MHDLKYANQIIDALKKELGDRRHAAATIDVYLSPFSHVTPERLKDVFEMLAGDEGYTKARLNVNIAEFRIHCNECGKKWKSSKPTFKCPKCDSVDFDLEKWEEFYIESIKVEK